MYLAFWRRGLALVAASLCIAALSLSAFAQVMAGTTAQGLPTTQTDTTLYTLTGSVVNSVTGEPVVRALVQIMGAAAPRAAFTDREGRFTFAKLNAMTGNLMAVKPGFYGSDQGGRQPMANTRVTVGPDMQPVVVKLVPESGIEGTITDEAGEPLENVRVGVWANTIQNGRRREQSMQSTQTDEQGNFHLQSLPPGNYKLSAGPVWASSAESKTGFSQQYFPGVTEAAEATTIDVQPGQTMHGDLTLPPAKSFTISGFVNGSNPGYPQIVNESGVQAGTVEMWDQNNGKFTAKVTCSVCTIKARSGNPRTDQEYGELTLTVNEDKHDLRVNMAQLQVPVTVDFQSSKPDFVDPNGNAVTPAGPNGRGQRRTGQQRNGNVFLRLFSLSKVHPDGFSTFNGNPDNPEMMLQNVEFGKYQVEVQAGGGGWYIASIHYGPTNLDDEPIDIQPGPPQSIEIVMKDDVASLSGNVTGNDDANAKVTVLLIPARASARIRNFPVSGNGTFQAGNLAPGQYKLYAFDNINDLEYANPEVMRQYSSKGVDVTLDSNGTASVNVPLTKRAQ